MTPSLSTEHLKRYHALARLLMKHGRSDLVQEAGLADALPSEEDGLPAETPQEGKDFGEELRRDLEAMGPTFVKIGQLLSTRPDILPDPYLEALSRLQDDVKPFDPSEAKEVVAQEVGVPTSEAFRTFEERPLAAASLAQVHYAELPDGRAVAVKVQRPGIRDRIAKDLEALERMAGILDRHSRLAERYDFSGILREFGETLGGELDYRREASSLRKLGRSLQDYSRLAVPQPVDDYTTDRVLTMEFVTGEKVTSLSPLRRMEMEGEELADQLIEAYLKQILVDGFFHADPHPGNLFLTEDRRLALLDLGMTARMSPRMQKKLLRLLLAVSEGKGEEAAEIAMGLADRQPWFDEPGFLKAATSLVTAHQDASVEDIEIGRVVMAVSRAASENGFRLPANLTMLGKTLLNLDRVGRALDPEFDPNAAVRRHAGDILQQRMLKEASPGNILSNLLEVNEFVQRLPARLNQAMDRISSNELRFKVDVFDEVHMMEGLQKVANRIAAGVILAALIVGSALFMDVDAEFTILGYPGIAILLFLAATAGGVGLLLSILFRDEKMDRRRKR